VTKEKEQPVVEVSAVINTGIASVSGIPPSLQANAFKAFGRLCSSVIDLGVARIGGKTREYRAETDSRIAIINSASQQIANALEVDEEYVRAAAGKFAQRIVREQINVDKIGARAASLLENEQVVEKLSVDASVDENTTAEISDDWLTAFERTAGEVSDDQVQSIFARLLAQEIRSPSSFSIRTIKLLGQLDTSAAALFSKLCSMLSVIKIAGHVLDARVISVKGSANASALGVYGFPFSALNTLNEYGLIIADYNSWMDYAGAIVRENKITFTISYGGKDYYLNPTQPDRVPKELKVHGVGLSAAGKELYRAIKNEGENQKFREDLDAYFAAKSVSLTEYSSKAKPLKPSSRSHTSASRLHTAK
jgi:hypothetical protein